MRHTSGQSSNVVDYAMEDGQIYDFSANPRPTLNLDDWTHLVIVGDTPVDGATAASAQFYVNGGVPAQTDVVYSFNSRPLDELFLLSNGYGGSFDDIYLWKRALSAIEVASLPTK